METRLQMEISSLPPPGSSVSRSVTEGVLETVAKLYACRWNLKAAGADAFVADLWVDKATRSEVSALATVLLVNIGFFVSLIEFPS